MENEIKIKWLRTKDAAIYLGISTTQIHVLKSQGILPFTKLGGSIYFDKSDIDKVLESNKVGEVQSEKRIQSIQ